jgi:uncharacterized surface protein with fasciclin (FAS1) repeats
MTARTCAALVLVLVLFAGSRASDSVTLLQFVNASKEHTVFALVATESKERAALSGNTDHTLFAPSDAAFKALPPAQVKALATDKAALTRLVRAHLVAGKYTVADLKKLHGHELKSLAGTALKVEVSGDTVTVGGAKLVGTEARCANGLVHITSGVLPLPKE